MLDFPTTARVALEELDAFSDRLNHLPDPVLASPTRCEGWDVTALARHVAGAAWQQAEAFHRVRLGAAEAPSYLETGAGVPLMDALAASRGHLVQGFAAVADGDDPAVPLPFATLPAGFAVQVLLIEYGFHRNDLEWALGEETPLRDEVAQVQVELLGAFLPMVATKPTEEETGFRLVAPTATTEVVFRDGAWQGEAPPPGRTCEVRGDDSAIALYALGRIPHDHGSLETDDPLGLAPRFKELFPGP